MNNGEVSGVSYAGHAPNIKGHFEIRSGSDPVPWKGTKPFLYGGRGELTPAASITSGSEKSVFIEFDASACSDVYNNNLVFDVSSNSIVPKHLSVLLCVKY